MDIGARIYQKRTQLGMTLEEVGKKVGVGKSTVRKWETGDIESMRVDKVALLSNALNVSPLYIMGFDTDALDLSPHETKVIKAYREKPEMQSSVDKLLDINKDDKLKSLSMKELLEANRLEDAPRYGVTAAATGNNEKFLVSKENEIEAKKILDDIHNQKLD